jgi:hypothetical protein
VEGLGLCAQAQVACAFPATVGPWTYPTGWRDVGEGRFCVEGTTPARGGRGRCRALRQIRSSMASAMGRDGGGGSSRSPRRRRPEPSGSPSNESDHRFGFGRGRVAVDRTARAGPGRLLQLRRVGEPGGVDIHSVDRIVPEWQDVAVGDPLRLAPQVALEVIAVEPGRALVVRGVVPMGEALAAPYDFVWAFVLHAGPDGTTRSSCGSGTATRAAGRRCSSSPSRRSASS